MLLFSFPFFFYSFSFSLIRKVDWIGGSTVFAVVVVVAAAAVDDTHTLLLVCLFLIVLFLLHLRISIIKLLINSFGLLLLLISLKMYKYQKKNENIELTIRGTKGDGLD